MVAVMLVAFRHHAIERKLDLERVLAGSEPGAVRYPEKMSVDSNGTLAEGDVEHDIGGLAADAGKRDQRLARTRHLAMKILDELKGQGDEVLGLVAIEADGLDPVGELFLAELDQPLRRIGKLEQLWRRFVHRSVSRLCRKHNGDEKSEGIGIMKLGLGVRVDCVEPAEHLGNLRLGQPRAGRFAALPPPLRLGAFVLCGFRLKGHLVKRPLFYKAFSAFFTHGLGAWVRDVPETFSIARCDMRI